MEVLILKIVIGLKFGQFGSVDCKWFTDGGLAGKGESTQTGTVLLMGGRRADFYLCGRKTVFFLGGRRAIVCCVAAGRPTERFVDMEVSRIKGFEL